MKKMFCLFMLLIAGPLMAQTPGEFFVAQLSEQFGQISHRDLETSNEFIFSCAFTDISSVLQLAHDNELYVQFISVSVRDDGKAAVLLKTGPNRKNAEHYFTALSNILRPGFFTWKSGKIPENMPVLTTIETSFDQNVKVQGVTLKSGLIFSHLFPMIERCGELNSPFFSQGTYNHNQQDGRFMTFTIDCKW